MKNQKVGFIGGGQMAQALASGALDSGLLAAGDVVFGEPDVRQRAKLQKQFPQAELVESGQQVLAACQRVVLAVKPQVLKQAASQWAAVSGPEHLLVSIAAGVSLDQLQEWFVDSRLIRVMPNTPAQVRAGAAAISAPESAAEADVQWVESLMGAVGISVRVPDHLIHAVTAVSGSSPAYFYLVIEALSDGGVGMGLPRETATRLAAQAMLGAAQMVLTTGLHPGVLKDQVTSPGGTTLAALRELEGAGVRGAFIEAVARCVERSQELA